MSTETMPEITRYNSGASFSSCPENGRDTLILHEGCVPYLSFRAFDGLPGIQAAFSTRLGGVSKGFRSSMDLGFHEALDTTPKEHEELARAASENFRRMGETLGIQPEQMVYSQQTHTVNILTVTGHHKGMGIVKARDFTDEDGLVTGEPGICLVTAFADCNPVLFADRTGKAVGAAHAGWKGTVGGIAGKMADRLNREFGCRREDLIVQIGPGICGRCYEVREDTARYFRDAYPESELPCILKKKDEEHYLLNLFAANYFNCIHAGIPAENIYISDMCTFENPGLLFSHRASHGKRGILCAFLMIRK